MARIFPTEVCPALASACFGKSRQGRARAERLSCSARNTSRGGSLAGRRESSVAAFGVGRAGGSIKHRNVLTVHMRGSAEYYVGEAPEGGDPEEELKRAVLMFNSGDFYSAHDVLEEMWHNSQDPQRSALHGVLQCAVGLHHLLNNNHRGCMIEFGEGLNKLNKLRPEGALEEFTQQASEVLEFLYDTQMEYAACAEDTGVCEVLDGGDEAYKLLGNYARGEELYSLEEREEDPNRFHQYIVYNPSKLQGDPTLVLKVDLPHLNIGMADLEDL
eukprot:CAMPEP_0198199934 /NCGR_PEP_ID=MMETSP1445-20131203/3037_1 /TAXON_ID=36898 /ORGANISM="Pyramimonas sp., Strain CCMP2087" /LENGTH=272 /DNA_ID=CAMNT_0043869845 /DNA_START=157 /DNA_END=975 /DNA_ORIENTATION=+